MINMVEEQLIYTRDSFDWKWRLEFLFFRHSKNQRQRLEQKRDMIREAAWEVRDSWKLNYVVVDEERILLLRV